MSDMKQNVKSLFEYIKELNKIKQRSCLNYKWSPFYQRVNDLPQDMPNIRVSYADRAESDDQDGNRILLTVIKPVFEACPYPDDILLDWLPEGWDRYDRDIVVKDKMPIRAAGDAARPDAAPDAAAQDEQYEYFADNERRVASFNDWLAKRNPWQEKQRRNKRVQDIFDGLYSISYDMNRNAGTTELIVCDGYLKCKDRPEIEYPLLTKRVTVKFDAENGIIDIEDTDARPSLFTDVFQYTQCVNTEAVKSLLSVLEENDYHPLDRVETPGFFKLLSNQLSSKGFLAATEDDINLRDYELNIYSSPTYIYRKRLDGTVKAIEQIIENIEQTGFIPEPILDLVQCDKVMLPPEEHEESFEERLAAVGGENADFLLAKEANREQLEIAKRIENYNAVLVQGPPGTGKTHTIANLMGHFLAQGKSILVTSQTRKALSVLKDKIPAGLQDLCVSALDDNNTDMEKSVDGITEHMSQSTSQTLKAECDNLAILRRETIGALAEVRKKIYAILYSERNSIVYDGEDWSPSRMARFVREHAADLDIIPGDVSASTPFPFTMQEVNDLYASNAAISSSDESELERSLPDPAELLSPVDFANVLASVRACQEQLAALAGRMGWTVPADGNADVLTIRATGGAMALTMPDDAALGALRDTLASMGSFDAWMKQVVLDGMKQGPHREKWDILTAKIQETFDFGNSILTERFGRKIHWQEGFDHLAHLEEFRKLQESFATAGKVSKITLFFNKRMASALNSVTIDGQQPQSAEDCGIVINSLLLQTRRKECAAFWDELFVPLGVSAFMSLDDESPESLAVKWIAPINRYLRWHDTEYADVLEKLSCLGSDIGRVFNKNELDADAVIVDKIFAALEHDLPAICELCALKRQIDRDAACLRARAEPLYAGHRCNSEICRNLHHAMTSENTASYRDWYAVLDATFTKENLLAKRKELLNRLEPIAPQWAMEIRNRTGIHGNEVPPQNIMQAWQWKQFSLAVKQVTEKPLASLQEETRRLGAEYRAITEKYADASAWYNLLKRTESDLSMRSALQSWKLTVKKIGKGLGKNAPQLKAKARELMAGCQRAVPAWIMPMDKALESLNPKVNSFDVIIIDEASQSDISSLAILYMGKKLIIVGDDKQVSPMSVGAEIDKMNTLAEMYIRGRIPNYHLYNAKTSIYDLASTVFQPLMLREHFRCAPDIIGFSNMLSYENRILPLRDTSNSHIIPSVVSHRVKDGCRMGKKNVREAQTIVALMLACMKQPEYAGKTFGVISLLGNDQVSEIQKLVFEHIDRKDIEARQILCGNASNFQGDERDVIFLSMVDSGREEGPLALHGFGPDDSYRKRYNVAASRAKDQLWVVHSLDAENDLKPGDIRKTLIDYARSPSSLEQEHRKIEKLAESRFEAEFCTLLSDRGYDIIQQRQVGAYRMDLVVRDGAREMAIECDGDQWHGSESQIRADMERQTILERLGWKFIRVRGSEFYSDKERALAAVMQQLGENGIAPSKSVEQYQGQYSDLHANVVREAQALMDSLFAQEEQTDIDTITAALQAMLPEEQEA